MQESLNQLNKQTKPTRDKYQQQTRPSKRMNSRDGRQDKTTCRNMERESLANMTRTCKESRTH